MRHSSVDGATTLVARLLRFFRVDFLDKIAFNRNFLALCTQLNGGLLVVNLANTAAMPLERATNNDNNLANKRIFDKSIFGCDELALCPFHELSTKNEYVSAGLHEYAVALNELLVPQEKVVPVVVPNRSDRSLERPLYYLYHLVNR